MTIALQAVKAAQGRVAACSSLRWAGAATAPSSGTTINSAITPSIGPPSERLTRSSVSSPAIQRCENVGQTRSPTENRVTPAPTSTTSPTPSEIGISGRDPVWLP